MKNLTGKQQENVKQKRVINENQKKTQTNIRKGLIRKKKDCEKSLRQIKTRNNK